MDSGKYLKISAPNTASNISIVGTEDPDDKSITADIVLNQKIFPKDVIYSAAYVFLDKAYIILDMQPGNDEILVKLRLKDNAEKKRKNSTFDDNIKELKRTANDFNNEVLSYLYYKNQSMKNKVVRDAIIRRLILTNESEPLFR